MSELYKLSIKEKLEGLKSKQFSSVEITQTYLDRIKLSTKVLNDKSLCKSIDKLFTSKTKTKSVVKKVKKLGDSVFFNTIKEINKALAK